jgi:hypothetical protein
MFKKRFDRFETKVELVRFLLHLVGNSTAAGRNESVFVQAHDHGVRPEDASGADEGHDDRQVKNSVPSGPGKDDGDNGSLDDSAETGNPVGQTGDSCTCSTVAPVAKFHCNTAYI